MDPMFRALLTLVLLVASLLSAPRADAESVTASFSRAVGGWEKVLNRAAERLDGRDFADADLEALRGELSAVFNEARAAGAAASGSLAQTRQLLDALGPAPAEGAGTESREVGAERGRLAGELAVLDGRVRQAELVATRADILMRTATNLRMDQFKQNLLKRERLPVSMETWKEVPAQLTFLGDRMRRAIVLALGFDAWDYRLSGLGALALASLGFAWTGRRWLLRRWGHRPVASPPGYRQKVVAAAVEAVARCLLPVVPTLATSLAVLAMLGGDAALAPLVAAVTAGSGGLVFFFLISGLARATLAPDHADWRLAEIGDDCARPMAHRVTVFAAGLAVAGGVFTMFQLQLAPPELAAVAGFAVQLVATLTLFPLLPSRFWSPEAGEGGCGCEPEVPAEDAGTGPVATLRQQSRRGLRLLAALTAVSTLAASAAGYHNLSVYAATLALAALALGGMLLLLRGVLRELVSLLVEEQSGPIASIRRTVIRTDSGLKAFDWVTRSLLDIVLLGVGLVVLLPLSGMDWAELRGLAEGIWRGVTIGGIRIAPADILTAAASFVIVVTVTRFVQRQLDERVLQRLQIDRGVQHSIRTGIGYLGVAIALLAAVGSLGLDLSSLALIAGALSVGIGFGLQAVVSNFVAGLILLVERPIKVGDWVVVGDKEGLVKRISVRSTEIQTFQRASVIIPNSELISSSVLNWTFKDRFGRVEIRVGVAYGTDLRKARDLLLSCTVGDRRISRTPTPMAVLRDFGPSALEFELRCFVGDVDNSLAVQSDLRFAIADAFAQHGIEIPYAQQVVHMPQIEALRALAESRSLAKAVAVPDEPANDKPALRAGGMA
jgi:small-conductance mechanosensitive channel